MHPRDGEETMIGLLAQRCAGGRNRLALAVAALVLAAPGLAAAKDPIEVGMAVALTGYLVNYDGQFINGVKLASAKANEAGGIDGHKINLHILDDASNATTGVTVTTQLLNQYNVSVMLNGLSSAQNAAIHPILARAKVPMVVFSVLPPDPVWAFLANLLNEKNDKLQVDFAHDGLHAKTIAILYSHTPYGQTGAKVMAEDAEPLGMKIVFSEGVEPSATDMTPQMAKLKDAAPDVVLDILTGSTHIVEAKSAATVGLKVPIVMATDDRLTLEQASAAYAQTYFAATGIQAYPHLPDPAMKAACAAFLAEYNKSGGDPGAIVGASFGWDAVRILGKAVETSGATGGEALRAGLEKVTLQGCNTLYKFTAADHSGQLDVPVPLQIGKIAGHDVEIVFPPQ
jgi:branched-chain amino acid transport system substrate-binding protein